MSPLLFLSLTLSPLSEKERAGARVQIAESNVQSAALPVSFYGSLQFRPPLGQNTHTHTVRHTDTEAFVKLLPPPPSSSFFSLTMTDLLQREEASKEGRKEGVRTQIFARITVPA